MNNISILIIGSIITIIMMFPSAFATSGSIELDDNEFKLYGDGTVTIFSITGTISDYSHKPTLEILHNNAVINSVTLFPNGGNLYGVIGLDKNLSPGEYLINLIHQNELLDTKKFYIFRDNFIETAPIINEKIFHVESFIKLEPSELMLDYNSDEKVILSGNIQNSHFGLPLKIFIHSPDGTSELIGTVVLPRNGFFDYPIYGIDKNWDSGKYDISVELTKNTNVPTLQTSLIIDNKFEKSILEKEKLIGSFVISSEVSNGYTILQISGNVETDQTEMVLQITHEESILFEDTLLLNDRSFETSTVLYDYESNTPWKSGNYQISGLIGSDSFYSHDFTLNDQSLSIFEISTMNLFLNFESEVQKMVDKEEIIISYGDEKQIILSGILENYLPGEIVNVHLVNPDGSMTTSHIRPSSEGEYYLPIIVNDSWLSGDYTAYITYGIFTDEPSSFNVINNAIVIETEILEDKISEENLEKLKHYSIILDNSQSVDSVHYIATMQSFSGKTPITISLNDEILKEEFTFSSDEGLIDYYLLLNENWISGNYTVSYIENNISTSFGTFEIFNNYIVEDELNTILDVEKLIDQTLTLEKSSFKSSSYGISYLPFSGKLIDDSTNKVSILLDGELQTTISLDPDGNYAGTISLGDSLDSGFHTLSMSSGDITESAEFLITTNHYISLQGDLQIFRNEIIESGGEISVFLSKMVPNFVPSEVQPVIITVEGDDSYQRFSVMPKGYGFYSQNFMLDETLGSYDVTVKYGGEIIESHTIDVLAIDPQWLREYTESWVYGKISDYSYFQKLVLTLDDDYTVTANVSAPDWFVESAAMWMRGLLDDDSFNDSIKFLAENRLL